MTTKFSWNEQNTADLLEAVSGIETVSQEQAAQLAEQLGTSARSVGAKLRKLGVTVATATKPQSAWTDELEAALGDLLESNPGVYTYAELVDVFGNGFTAKQLQGKILHMELTGLVKKSEKQAAARKYTEAEEAQFVALVEEGKFLEDIAIALGRTVPQVRGKALSLVREGRIAAQPKQAVTASTSRSTVDLFADIDVSEFTVAELAAKLDKAERSIKASLTRKALTAKDYDGAAKAAKAAAKREAAAE